MGKSQEILMGKEKKRKAVDSFSFLYNQLLDYGSTNVVELFSSIIVSEEIKEMI